jgi:hypothetical protein
MTWAPWWDAPDVGEDLAPLGSKRRGERDRRRVAAASTERRDLLVEGRCGALALEAGHDRDLPVLQLGPDATGLHARDAGPAVGPVGRDAGLRPGQADRRHPDRVEGHGDERRALVLAGGQQHVELARVRVLGDGGRQPQQLVGRVAHGRDHDHEVVAGRSLAGDAAGHALDAVGARDGRAAEFLDDEGGRHRRPFYRGRIR